MADENYSQVRRYLGSLIGQRLVDVTQEDQADWDKDKTAFTMLMFEDGSTVKFEHHSDPKSNLFLAFVLDGPVAKNA